MSIARITPVLVLAIVGLAACASSGAQQLQRPTQSPLGDPDQVGIQSVNDCPIDIRPRNNHGGPWLLVEYHLSETTTELWITSNSKAEVWDDKGVSHGRIPDSGELKVTVGWKGAQNEKADVESLSAVGSKQTADIPTKGAYMAAEPSSSPCYELEGAGIWNVIRVQNKGRSTRLHLKK